MARYPELVIVGKGFGLIVKTRRRRVDLIPHWSKGNFGDLWASNLHQAIGGKTS
jgi:hypothetical protein